jgi:hypothetical protein
MNHHMGDNAIALDLGCRTNDRNDANKIRKTGETMRSVALIRKTIARPPEPGPLALTVPFGPTKTA